jgi:hypothetical protein
MTLTATVAMGSAASGRCVPCTPLTAVDDHMDETVRITGVDTENPVQI